MRHRIINDGVDGTVQVDAEPAEEDKPDVQVWRIHERVDHHQGTVRHPQKGKEDHNHGQHLCYLWDCKQINKTDKLIYSSVKLLKILRRKD